MGRPPSSNVLVHNVVQRHTKPDNSTTDLDSSAPRLKRMRIAADPYTETRAQLEYLTKHPERDITIPRPPSPSSQLPPPPELVTNVQGSSAGAGSGEFHVYKQARRREMERTKVFEAQRSKEASQAEFEEKREKVRNVDEERTAKRREKRRRRGKKEKMMKGPTADEEHVGAAEEEAQEEVPSVDGEINLTIIDDFDM
ncbi:uncharacterized protein V1518DRAFT_423423 [Limtongia smithiae]|uniref:uncharacterized protein n=1 Tax=Limtongia smithiae TaxID=1125753 RepID=UPI0034CD8DEE